MGDYPGPVISNPIELVVLFGMCTHLPAPLYPFSEALFHRGTTSTEKCLPPSAPTYVLIAGVTALISAVAVVQWCSGSQIRDIDGDGIDDLVGREK